MFRGIARASILPRKALLIRQATPTFSTQSMLRRPQEIDDKVDDTHTQDATDSTPKSDISASIPFTSEPQSSSKESSKINSESTWQDLLSLVSSTSSSFTSSSSAPRLYTGEDTKPLDAATKFEEHWIVRERGGPLSVSKPSDGRIFSVKGHVDVNRAYGSLMSLLARNGVRKELRLQERYEKPNEKRRRLKSERHRRRFAAAVREKVQLVMELQARGV